MYWQLSWLFAVCFQPVCLHVSLMNYCELSQPLANVGLPSAYSGKCDGSHSHSRQTPLKCLHITSGHMVVIIKHTEAWDGGSWWLPWHEARGLQATLMRKRVCRRHQQLPWHEARGLQETLARKRVCRRCQQLPWQEAKGSAGDTSDCRSMRKKVCRRHWWLL